MRVVGQASVNAGANVVIDLGNDSYKYQYRVAGVHADGTLAPFRGKLSSVNPDNAAATDAILCAGGQELIRPTRASSTARYLQILGLSDATLVTVSMLAPGEVC